MGLTVPRANCLNLSARSAPSQHPGPRCHHDAHLPLVSARLPPNYVVTAMNAIEHALLAVMAANGGDSAAALGHISHAQQYARATARRERQIVEIAALVIATSDERAAGLTLEHIAEFPDDADLLARISATSAAEQQPGSQSST
jgi:hypothetical protein